MDFVIQGHIVRTIQPGFRQTMQQIADQAVIHRNTANKYVQRLVGAGVIIREGKGRRGSFLYRINRQKAEEMGYL